MSMAAEMVAAVKARDSERVQSLLAENPDLARIMTDEGSLLLTAVYFGAREAVRMIREIRTDLDVCEAAAVGDADRLTELLGGAPDLANGYNPEGLTPLGLAAHFGHLQAVEVLLDNGAAIDALSRSTREHVPRNTALHAAFAGHAWAVAEALIARGAGVGIADSAGMEPLHHAALHGNVQMVTLLLERGAAINARDGRGETPLTHALRRGHAEVAALLKERGGEA